MHMYVHEDHDTETAHAGHSAGGGMHRRPAHAEAHETCTCTCAELLFEQKM